MQEEGTDDHTHGVVNKVNDLVVGHVKQQVAADSVEVVDAWVVGGTFALRDQLIIDEIIVVGHDVDRVPVVEKLIGLRGASLHGNFEHVFHVKLGHRRRH